MVVAASGCLGMVPLLQAVEILVNGGFENEPNYGLNTADSTSYSGYTVFTGNGIPGWTIAANHAATIHNTSVYPTISGNYSLNTDGEGSFGNNVLIYQDFASTSGAGYNFSFNWETWFLNTPAELEVKVFDTTTSAVLFDGVYPGTANRLIVQSVNSTFAGTGDILRLQIDENPQSGNNDNAFIVDDFSVTASSVPDSTGWSAELAAFLFIGGMARRFRPARA